jgi:hypothetical protein
VSTGLGDLNSSQKKLLALILCALGLFVVAVSAWQIKEIDIPLIGSNGDVSFSDSSRCSTWLSDHDSPDVAERYSDAQHAYLESKLHIPDALTSERGSVYWSGMLVNCNDVKTVGEAFASTDELIDAYGLRKAETAFNLSIVTGVAP